MSGGGYEEEGHENHERWIVSYADFITLLFATFTALYAVANQNTSKAEAFEQSINQAMSESIWEKISNASASGGGPKVMIPTLKDSGGLPKRSFIVAEERCIETALEKQEREKFSGEAAEDLEAILDPEMESVAEVKQREDDLVVSLKSAGLFGSGSADLKPEAVALFKPVIEKLREYENIEIKVEGHTDNLPLKGGRWGSNWGLSAARATAVVTTLVDVYEVAPDTLSAVGLAEHHPIATNKTASGRSKNRRIDLVIRQRKPPVEEWEKSVRKRLSGRDVLGKQSPEEEARAGQEAEEAKPAQPLDAATKTPVEDVTKDAKKKGGGDSGLGATEEGEQLPPPPEPTKKPVRRGPPPEDQGAALPVGLFEDEDVE